MIRALLKEAGLLMAFVVLAGLLLLCLWVSENFDRSILRDFKNAQVTLMVKERGEDEIKSALELNDQVLSYKMYRAKDNKDRLVKIYPELGSVVGKLEEKYFPVSALVSVKDPDAFLGSLKSRSNLIEAQIIHRPPLELQRFINILAAIFSVLWLITLSLVLYFHLERLAVKELPRWSLMKMLGEKPQRMFLPLWMGQLSRIVIASICALGLAMVSIGQIRGFISWNWASIPYLTWSLFFVISICVTTGLSFILFYSQFRRVQVG